MVPGRLDRTERHSVCIVRCTCQYTLTDMQITGTGMPWLLLPSWAIPRAVQFWGIVTVNTTPELRRQHVPDGFEILRILPASHSWPVLCDIMMKTLR